MSTSNNEYELLKEKSSDWVRKNLCPIPQSICKIMQRYYTDIEDIFDFDNITQPRIPSVGDVTSDYETVTHVIGNAVGLDSGRACLYTELDCNTYCTEGYWPMWGTMWYFREQYLWDDDDTIGALSECGFKVYRSKDLGLVFGIDGMGFDFYEAYWIPLYKKLFPEDTQEEA